MRPAVVGPQTPGWHVLFSADGVNWRKVCVADGGDGYPAIVVAD